MRTKVSNNNTPISCGRIIAALVLALAFCVSSEVQAQTAYPSENYSYPECFRYDTDRNGCVDAEDQDGNGDAAAVIKEVSRMRNNSDYQSDISIFDTTEDGYVSARDALVIINCVGRATGALSPVEGAIDCRPCLCDYLR